MVNKEMDRRNFLIAGGLGSAAAVAYGFPLLSGAARALHKDEGHGDSSASSDQWGMVVDIKKCLNEDVRRAFLEDVPLHRQLWERMSQLADAPAPLSVSG